MPNGTEGVRAPCVRFHTINSLIPHAGSSHAVCQSGGNNKLCQEIIIYVALVTRAASIRTHQGKAGKSGRYGGLANEVAARTVMKEHTEKGHQKRPVENTWQLERSLVFAPAELPLIAKRPENITQIRQSNPPLKPRLNRISSLARRQFRV